MIGVGIIGLGRAGWDIHASTISHLKESFAVTAVVDRRPDRRSEAAARFGCAVYDDIESLLANPEVDLAVVATTSHVRTDLVVALLEAGKHVLVEKPFAPTLTDADRMFRAASENGRLLTCGQNRRYAADFIALRDVVESGILGALIEVKTSWHSFRRRWDWQTVDELGGGVLRNDGSHALDQVLVLLGANVDYDVFCRRTRTNLTAGDAEDHAKIVLTSTTGTIVDIELSNCAAYPQAAWQVFGSDGSATLADGELRWKVVDWEASPRRELVATSPTDRGYPVEGLSWTERVVSIPPEDYTVSHRRMYDHLAEVVANGALVDVRADEIRRQIEIIQRCREAAPVRVVT